MSLYIGNIEIYKSKITIDILTFKYIYLEIISSRKSIIKFVFTNKP